MKFYVVGTRFHGEGTISVHATREAAEHAARENRSAECECGCAGVVTEEEYEELPYMDDAGVLARHLAR